MFHAASGALHTFHSSPPHTALITLPLQATPRRCDVIVGCEDGLLGCIMGSGGSGVSCAHADAATSDDSTSDRYGTVDARTDASDATAAAAAALERIVRAATSDAAELEAEEAAAAAASAAAAAAAAVSAAEKQDAGVFRAIRVHDAAVLCVSVMLYNSSVVFMSGGADGRLVMCR